MALEKEVQEKLDGLVNDIEAKVKKSVEETGEGMRLSVTEEIKKEFGNVLNKEEIDQAIDAAHKELTKSIAEINKRFDQMDIDGQKPKGGFSSKSVGEQVAEQLKAKSDNLKNLKDSNQEVARGGVFSFEIKAAGTMLTSSNVSGGNVPVEDRLEGFNIIPSRRVRLLDIMSQRSTSSTVVSWTYQANKDGSAGQTAEGAVKNQIDFDIVVASQSIKKTTAFIKVSDEMIDDISWMNSEINNELLRELLKSVESQAYSGNNTGQNLNGVRTVATAFAAGTFANAVDNADTLNVLDVALNQIKIAEHDLSRPAILMHPSDVTAMKMVKVSGTDRRYVDRLYIAGSNLMLDGTVPIIETTLVTAGDYLVGDFNLALLVQKDGVRIEVGYDADDFTKNLRTIRAEWRGLVIVKNNDRTAFVKGDFATDKAALETA